MEYFLDISVHHFTGNYTRKAKTFKLRTQILVKVPAWDLTTVRLIGTKRGITDFLTNHFTKQAVRNLVKAIKPLVEDAPHWKNRYLMENRNAS